MAYRNIGRYLSSVNTISIQVTNKSPTPLRPRNVIGLAPKLAAKRLLKHLKTKQFLLDNNYGVTSVSKNALELANYLVSNFKGEEFIFFCGDKRREELPSLLSWNNISFKEVVVYNTKLQAKKIHETFKGVLLFSPSGVESFVLENDLNSPPKVPMALAGK